MNIKLQRNQILQPEIIYMNYDVMKGHKKRSVSTPFFSSMVNIPYFFFLPLIIAIESAFLVESALRNDSALIIFTESVLRIESA